MQANKQEIKEFYNNYVSYQISNLNNERHFYVLDLIKKNGLLKNSNVLDLGCGIGSFSALIAQFCYLGNVKGYDISDKSIEVAIKNYAHLKNISFTSADISTENLDGKLPPDFILLVDVLEHIPREEHAALFQKIAGILSDQSKLIINIPYYAALEYERLHNKDALQIIDEPVELSYLSSLCEKCKLEIKQVETFDMWQKEEYQFIVVEKKKEYRFIRMSPKKTSRFSRILFKLKGIF